MEKDEPKKTLSLIGLCQDPDVNADAKFLEDCQSLTDRQQTSKLFTPFISQLKSIQVKARRSLKKRIDHKLKVKSLAYALVSNAYASHAWPWQIKWF